MRILCPVDFSSLSALKEMTVGNTTAYLMNHASIPLISVPDEYQFQGLKKIVIGLEQWQESRSEITEFSLTTYNPYLLVGALDVLLIHLDQAQKQPDFSEAKAIVDAFQGEFQTVREFHQQNFYPLDLWWDLNAAFVEIHDATDDPKLALLEWQELECMFDKMVGLLHDYENRAEEHLTQYAPQVDEDTHKAAMNQVYGCIATYQEALTFGYQENLVWPCDQIEGALRDILRCYVPSTENESSI